ncbi:MULTISPECIES: hypothetical protein [unclassified Duganella]|uniref:hypothetical protein n=1 Tax=unclassified Duganella TaxID=2636909 RepID=UPI0007005C1D|nr:MULTISPECIES: hypothetical protein [unclassified Duganella]KQV47623.1 hypothetical protein ASD07_11850 [Duganella sp. Root336D2]KRB82089.1 hypothetical protein ASE26_14430 [Duganella sp. Root198D2]
MTLLLRFIRLSVCILCVSSAAVAGTEKILPAPAVEPLELRVAVSSDGHAAYFVRLLEESLKSIHQPYRLHYVKDVPARRMWWMLNKGDINLFYGMQSKEKDSNEQIVRVRNALTNGLIGQRVFLIRQADTEPFARVHSVGDLKRTKMIAGFGAGWGDAKVWRKTGLPLYEHTGPWGTIYAMVAAGNRHVDYLPRGVIEVIEEARLHPELAVEQNLVVDYRADFAFYLAASSARYRPIIERALRDAEASGLKARLIDEAFGADIKALGLDRRTRLHLAATPD